MKQEEKQKLLIALCGYLPYGVMVEYDYGDGVKRATEFHGNYHYLMSTGKLQWKEFKPYLRPMSSMTEEEYNEYEKTLLFNNDFGDSQTIESFDWLNKNKFDYRGLIPAGLALEAPKGMYEIVSTSI